MPKDSLRTEISTESKPSLRAYISFLYFLSSTFILHFWLWPSNLTNQSEIFSDSPFNKITDFQCRRRGGSNSFQMRQPQLHACGLISLLYRWTKFWPRLWPVMVIIHQLVDIECFQESLNRVMRSLQRALMNAKLSSLSLLPSGRLTVPRVNKKAHATYSHAKTQMITVSAPHCPLRSLPYGYKRSTYGSVHVVFPVRKALFGCAYGSS